MKLYFDILRCMILLVGLVLLASCSASGSKGDRLAAQPNAPSSTSTQSKPQAAFWAALEALCGQAFEGRVVEDSTASPDFARTPLVMHARRCEDGRILVPFHIADNRSRTWVFTKLDGGLRLKHDHRHADGSEDDLTQYGGDTIQSGTATRQEFHADEFTASLLPAARTNIWTVEIMPGDTFAYALRRTGTDRRFRVEFDLSKPVTPPPAPWGH